MDIQTKNNRRLRAQVINLGYEISGGIDHAECFYDKEMLEEFCDNLDKLKNVAREYFISNELENEKD